MFSLLSKKNKLYKHNEVKTHTLNIDINPNNMQHSQYKGSDKSHFVSVWHFLAVNSIDKDALKNVAQKRWYQPKRANTNKFPFLHKNYN